jgi:energy-coupling factor transport system ATP-binding protein
VIQVRNLTFSYDDVAVLQDISVDLAFGQSVAILGPNGSGKSTFLRCLNGLLQPDGGDVLVDGLSTANAALVADIRRRVGLLFQNPDEQIVSALVDSDIAFGLENLGYPHEEIVSRVDEALVRFQLQTHRNRSTHALSGGERQRLALAGVWAMRPRFLLLDEPTALLDPKAGLESLDLLFALPGDGVTPVIVTHEADAAARADRVIVLREGRIVEDGPSGAVLSNASRLTLHGLDTTLPARVARRLGQVDPLPVTAIDLVQTLSATPTHPVTHPPRACTTTSTAIDSSELRHIYNEGLPDQTVALDGVSLTVHDGETVAVVGPSGSGKSTFALHLNGLLFATGGRLSVFGRAVTPNLSSSAALELRREVGLIFQFPETQLFAETVSRDIAFGPENLGMNDVERLVDRALDEVGLASATYGDRDPLTLSGGEKRRVAIAGVLVTKPRLVVLDEPTAALDPAAAADFDELLARLKADGVTLIMITHDLDRASRMCDRIIAFTDGRVAFAEPPSSAFEDRDRLSALGLVPPQVLRLADDLRAAGCPIPLDAITEDHLVAALGGHSTV